MSKKAGFLLFMVAVILIAGLATPISSQAEALQVPEIAGTAFNLINAVNTLRVSNGLSAYSINSILMYTAQNQADFMAATENVTYSGPGGIGLTDRLLAAGYPLAGDLSLGGFRAENITAGNESMSAQSAVDQWMGDAPHLNTMLSPNLTEIGAGVSISNGKVFYVIDAALPTTGGAPQAWTPVVGGGSSVPANETPIPVVVVNTPDQNGEVIHEVLAGQTLWQIAISYDVKIDDIKRLNNLFDDNIYPGGKLLISKVARAKETPIVTATATAITSPTVTNIAAPTMLVLITETIPPIVVPGKFPDNSSIMVNMIGIIVLALLAGGLFIRFGNAKRE